MKSNQNYWKYNANGRVPDSMRVGTMKFHLNIRIGTIINSFSWWSWVFVCFLQIFRFIGLVYECVWIVFFKKKERLPKWFQFACHLVFLDKISLPYFNYLMLTFECECECKFASNFYFPLSPITQSLFLSLPPPPPSPPFIIHSQNIIKKAQK